MSKGRQTLLSILLALGCVGFLAPRFELAGTRIALTDLICLLIIGVVAWGPTTYVHLKLGFRKFELFYSGVLLVLGFGYSIAYADTGSFALSVRILVFCLAGISVAFLSTDHLRRTLKVVTIILLLWFGPAAARVVGSLLSGEISLVQFMWEYDAGRLTAPYEVSGTSSVPLGYLFAFVFLYGLYQLDARRSVGALLFTIMGLVLCFLTASRASILSAALVLVVFMVIRTQKMGLKGMLVSAALILPIILAIGWSIIEKSLVDGDGLDSSGMQRLGYYTMSVNNLFSNPISLLAGFGVSDVLLEQRTGVAFYESLLFNSLAQGGVLLLIPSLGLVLSPMLQAAAVDSKSARRVLRNLLALGAIVFIGNSIGGANFFSVYAYMYYSLLFELFRRKA